MVMVMDEMCQDYCCWGIDWLLSPALGVGPRCRKTQFRIKALSLIYPYMTLHAAEMFGCALTMRYRECDEADIDSPKNFAVTKTFPVDVKICHTRENSPY